jgi:3-vinyl bacteriochlorophyllide hydratase
MAAHDVQTHHMGSHQSGAAPRKASRAPRTGWLDMIAPAPWGATAGLDVHRHAQPLYTPEERARRDATVWTLVQGILAPLQFAVFLVSVVLVVRWLETGQGYQVAVISVLAKTALLYTIMITGSVWEKVVFGKWLFARPFFWEDVVSMGVIALHTAYLAAWFWGIGNAHDQMILALSAYAIYAINAVQFLLKLRAARLEGAGRAGTPAGAGAHSDAVLGGAR